jgi:hypothetical protein
MPDSRHAHEVGSPEPIAAWVLAAGLYEKQTHSFTGSRSPHINHIYCPQVFPVSFSKASLYFFAVSATISSGIVTPSRLLLVLVR